MLRRSFLAGATLASLARRTSAQQVVSDSVATTAEVFVERTQAGKPRVGAILAAIQPHSDDIPLFAGGTVAKLVEEGATGYLIRVTR